MYRGKKRRGGRGGAGVGPANVSQAYIDGGFDATEEETKVFRPKRKNTDEGPGYKKRGYKGRGDQERKFSQQVSAGQRVCRFHFPEVVIYFDEERQENRCRICIYEEKEQENKKAQETNKESEKSPTQEDAAQEKVVEDQRKAEEEEEQKQRDIILGIKSSILSIDQRLRQCEEDAELRERFLIRIGSDAIAHYNDVFDELEQTLLTEKHKSLATINDKLDDYEGSVKQDIENMMMMTREIGHHYKGFQTYLTEEAEEDDGLEALRTRLRHFQRFEQTFERTFNAYSKDRNLDTMKASPPE